MEPDPRSVGGALSFAANRIEARDAEGLYRVIDERARHAMISIVADRHRAAEAIEADYPEEERRRALESLGQASRVADAPALFAARCDRECMQEMASRIAASRSTRREDDLLIVTTVLDTEVRLFRREDGHWYGIVWHTEELIRERARANRDLALIERNAETYARRRELSAEESDE